MNPKIICTLLFGLAWAGTAVFGKRALFKYENAPGKVGSISSTWPAKSVLYLASDRPTLVMLVHPQCPCSRASIDELAQVMARSQGGVRAYVLFYVPREAGGEWQNTDTRRSAARIAGVTVLSDIDGAEAARFGAETSGHTFLFDASGHLLFNGGITASRGHSGDNAGESALVALINNRERAPINTFVFGCSFKDRVQENGHCSR